MPRIEKRTRGAVVAASIVAAAAIVVFGYLQEIGYLKTYIPMFTLDDYVFFAVITAIAPIAAASAIDYHWRKNIDAHLPDLFRSIVQAQEVGMTLPQAMEEASKQNFGPLTPELKKMTIQVSWGYSFEEALATFGNRVGTVLVQRTLPMIVEASRSGGRVEKVIDPMGKFIRTNNLLEKQRNTQTRPYTLIIYVALFVFLFTIIMLFKTFFAAAQGMPLISGSAADPEDMKRIFLHMTLIQGFFGGLAAGKMGEGSVAAGLKHSLVMMLLGYAALKLFM